MPKRYVTHTKRPRPNYATAYMLWKWLERDDFVSEIKSLDFDPRYDQWNAFIRDRDGGHCPIFITRAKINRIRKEMYR